MITSLLSEKYRTRLACRRAIDALADERPDSHLMRPLPNDDGTFSIGFIKATAKDFEQPKKTRAPKKANGKLPSVPDFSAPSRERYRTKLGKIVDLARAKDVKGLKAFSINPVDSANKIMDRYRNECVAALTGGAK